MRFFLGTHVLKHLSLTSVPLFISARQFKTRKKKVKSCGTVSIDSGGFTELSMYGKWSIDYIQYIKLLKRIIKLGVQVDWAAQQDWMVEPWMLEKTGLSVYDHQELTVENYLNLTRAGTPCRVIPVLQGWTLDDYQNCFDLFERKGVALRDLPLVGIGSVCRRQDSDQICDIVSHFYYEGLSLHGFGVKIGGLSRYGRFLRSSDSLAWSYGARMSKSLCGVCEFRGCMKKNCANCIWYALNWRSGILRRLRNEGCPIT